MYRYRISANSFRGNYSFLKVKNVEIFIQSNLAIRNGLIRNKLVLRNHFLWPICHLLHKDKELLALRNNFRATKKFLIAKFDCITLWTYSINIFPLPLNHEFLLIENALTSEDTMTASVNILRGHINFKMQKCT